MVELKRRTPEDAQAYLLTKLAERTARIEELEREVERLKGMMLPGPCQKCGADIIADCYGCRLKAAEAKLSEKGRAFSETLLMQSEELSIVRAELAEANKEIKRWPRI